ncbi:MAG: polysaccharide pyruvyl transferase family protein [Pseudomonadota bacterium]|nr:polysaccharide pyruvyl transferase family protein [Pseudomonadota bacterium]
MPHDPQYLRHAGVANVVGLIGRGGARLAPEALQDLDLLLRTTSGNVGNFAFWRGTRLLLGGDVRSMAARLPLSPEVRALVIPAANWLSAGSDFGWLADVVESANLPTLLLGLGAQAGDDGQIPQLPAGTLRLLAAVEQRSPFMAVRGEFTRRVCAHYGIHRVRVLGCPSMFLNPDRQLGARIAQRWSAPCRRLASHGFTERGRATGAERVLFAMIAARDDAQFIVQAPRALLGAVMPQVILTAADQQALAAVAARIAPELSVAEFHRCVQQQGYLPTSIDAWLAQLSGFSHTLNTRIHGTLMSLAAGVPGICLTHDTRTLELAATMRAPQLAVESIAAHMSPEDLFACAGFDGAAFDHNRMQLARGYVELLQAVGVTPAAAAIDLAA